MLEKPKTEAEISPASAEISKKDKTILITLNFKLWLVRILIVVYTIYYFVPYNIKEEIYQAKHWGPEFPVSALILGGWFFLYLYLLLYFAVINEFSAENKKSRIHLFIIIFSGYLYFASLSINFIGIYNPLFFIPVILSFTLAFYGTKYYKPILIIYLLPLIAITLDYLLKFL